MNKPEIIGQGSYGCVYKPSIQCDGTVPSNKYISKIQLIEQATKNEKGIGADCGVLRIKHIKNKRK